MWAAFGCFPKLSMAAPMARAIETRRWLLAVPLKSAPNRTQRLHVKGEELLAKVRELIHQGNVRRIHVIGEDGASIMEIPLTAGVIGAVVAPVLVAIGAIAALAKNYTLLIEAHTPPS